MPPSYDSCSRNWGYYCFSLTLFPDESWSLLPVHEEIWVGENSSVGDHFSHIKVESKAPGLQFARHSTMQINRLRTSATFQSPHVCFFFKKKSIYEMESVGPPREDTQKMRSSWVSLLIIFIDPSTGSHPVRRHGCTREIWGSTFNGSETLQGESREHRCLQATNEVPGCPAMVSSDCNAVQ